jgi:hypothetical protein
LVFGANPPSAWLVRTDRELGELTRERETADVSRGILHKTALWCREGGLATAAHQSGWTDVSVVDGIDDRLRDLASKQRLG